MFKKFMNRLRKRQFGGSVILLCNQLIYDLLENDKDNDLRKLAEEKIGYNCFDIFREKGSERIPEFRKEIIEKVLGIVTSDNPIISMRKELIEIIHSQLINQTFISDKFYDRRQELYELFNKETKKTTLLHSDETISVFIIRLDAESCILRMLQHKYFEEIRDDDWFTTYSKAYKSYIEMLFELILLEKDGKDISKDSGVSGLLFQGYKQTIETFQQKLIGEILNP